MYFSIDGDEKTHDEIRGKDSYKKLKETYIKIPFRKCTIEDFQRVGFKINQKQEDDYKNRLCPEKSIDDFLEVKNSYNNKWDRESF